MSLAMVFDQFRRFGLTAQTAISPISRKMMDEKKKSRHTSSSAWPLLSGVHYRGPTITVLAGLDVKSGSIQGNGSRAKGTATPIVRDFARLIAPTGVAADLTPRFLNRLASLPTLAEGGKGCPLCGFYPLPRDLYRPLSAPSDGPRPAARSAPERSCEFDGKPVFDGLSGRQYRQVPTT